MENEFIKQLIGLDRFDNNRISTISLALNNARFHSNNNLFVLNYKNSEFEEILTSEGLNYEFLFTGLLTYLIFMEQIGSLLRKKKLKIEECKPDIINCLNVFYSDSELSQDEKENINTFRNCFAHRFGLATQNKDEKSKKFSLNFSNLTNNKIIIIINNPWSGNFDDKSDNTDTVVNVFNFINLCEDLYLRILKEIENENLELKIPQNEILARYTIL